MGLMTRLNTINIKIVTITAAALMMMSVGIHSFATHYLRGIIDKNEQRIYSEKIDAIFTEAGGQELLLLDSMLEEMFLSRIKKRYYDAEDLQVYPTVFSKEGVCLAHPDPSNILQDFSNVDFVQRMMQLKEGAFEFSLDGEKVWIIFKSFEERGWIISYIVPLSVKYASFYQYSRMLNAIMFLSTLCTLIIVSQLVFRFTRPIKMLTAASRELARGNLEYEVELESADEIGVLTQSFINMRDSIRDKISDLNRKNQELREEIARRTEISNALKASEQRYRLLIENQNDLIVKYAPDKRLTFVSPSICRLTNKSESELIGTPLYVFYPPDKRDDIDRSYQEMRFPPHTLYHEEPMAMPDGVHWIAWSCKAILNDSGVIEEVISVGREITARKNVEQEREQLIEELQHKNLEMEHFLFTVSHDLKSPLITIEGFLKIIMEEIKKESYGNLFDYITRVIRASSKMRKLLNDVLSLSRVGRVVNPSDTFFMDEVIEEAMELLAIKITQMKAEITIDETLPAVYADRQRIMEVMMNLLENALKFTKESTRPTIHIGCITEKGQNIFYIKDNGIGIESKYFEKIFGLFDKLNPETEGTGVGLALVRRIIELHHGHIWVESDKTGTIFYFTISTHP